MYKKKCDYILSLFYKQKQIASTKRVNSKPLDIIKWALLKIATKNNNIKATSFANSCSPQLNSALSAMRLGLDS